MAINARLSSPQTRNREEVTYTGRWPIGATGAVGTKVGGMGMTLTRTAEGLYTVTLESTPAAVLHVSATLRTNVNQLTVLTYETTGATFRSGAYASPQTAADPADGDAITIQVTCLKSLVK